MRQAQEKRLESQIQSSTEKIEKLTSKMNDPNNLNEQRKNAIQHDWSARYEFWAEWEDVEELGDTLENEKTKLQSLKEGQSSFMGHHHDHSEGQYLDCACIYRYDIYTHCHKHITSL